jgi:hypothetical protein
MSAILSQGHQFFWLWRSAGNERREYLRRMQIPAGEEAALLCLRLQAIRGIVRHARSVPVTDVLKLVQAAAASKLLHLGSRRTNNSDFSGYKVLPMDLHNIAVPRVGFCLVLNT